MREYDRLQNILNLLDRNKTVSVHDLSRKLYVSDATIRRDLTLLESQGQVRRVFGGALLLEKAHLETAFHGRSTQEEALQRMAQEAVLHIRDGDTVMLDASTSAAALIPYMRRFHGLTIISNSAVSTAGLQDLNAEVYITGGYMPRNGQGYIGGYALDMLSRFNASILFFTCAGLTTDGRVTDKIEEENVIRRVMLRQSRKHVLLCEAAKFGLEATFNLCGMEDVQVLISDQPFSGVGREKQQARTGE